MFPAKTALSIACALSLSSAARGQCADWDTGFRLGGFDNLPVRSAVFDDGTGPAIYAVGSFAHASGAPARSVARFDGSRWLALPHASDEPLAALYAIDVFDDGTGPALYVGGDGWATGSGTASVARWNGSTWTPLIGGPASQVRVLQHFGGSLYAGGDFTQVGGQFLPGLARWTGSVWGGVAGVLGSGSFGVHAMTVFDDGSGPALYAGGGFTQAGDVSSPYLARWSGSIWSAVPTGITTPVTALTVFDLGDGPELVAAGQVQQTGGYVKRLHAGAWLPIGAPASGPIQDIVVHDDHSGGGPRLYVGGNFATVGGVSVHNVARFDGTSWSALGAGTDGPVSDLLDADVSGASRLCAFGNFQTAGGELVRRAGQWDGTSWAAIDPNTAIDGGTFAFAHFDDGHGDALYFGGSFTVAGNVTAKSIARFDGTSWSALGAGITGQVVELCTFDDGTGEQLYVGGFFSSIVTVSMGTVAVPGIGRWNGTQWSALPGQSPLSVNDYVTSMVVFDDGSGSALYLAGHLDMPALNSRNVVRWRNGTWSALGGGVEILVSSLAVHDDGAGPKLYAGGYSQSGALLPHILRWDGSTWSNVGGGIGDTEPGASVNGLVSFDDGSGPALYAGGSFASAGGSPASNIARFQNGAWSPLGAGTNSAAGTLAVFDDGTGNGPALHAGGSFIFAGGVPHFGIARWDGTAWSGLSTGIVNAPGSYPGVSALAVWKSPLGRDLYVGGSFVAAGGHTSSNIARWNGCNETGRTFCYGDGSGAACPCGNTSTSGDRAGCTHSFGFGATLRASGEPSLSDDTLVLNGAAMPATTAVLYFQGAGVVAGGAGSAFGDGLRCAGGPYVRLGTKTNQAGASSYPTANDPSISTKGAVLAPGVRRYQARYRNSAAFCTAETFNYTNAVEILWVN